MRASDGRLSRRAVLGLIGAAAVGCGQQTYEARLNESQKYFAYVQKLDANLAPPWKSPPVEELRVPLQFREIKKPALVKNEEGKLVEPEIDPRQPDYVALKFPGLWGTWEAPFNVVVDGQAKPIKGYLYCLTNAAMLVKPDEAKRAPDFVKELLVVVAEKLQVPQLDYATAAERQTHPRSQSYSTPNNFDLFRFQGESLRIDGVPYTFEVYAHYQGSVQAALVLVTPVGIDSSAQLGTRVPLMLERFKLSPKVPLAVAPSVGGGTSPGGGQPAPTGF